jgi:Tol biopolymer transport system component
LKKRQGALLSLLALAAAITVGCGDSSNPFFTKLPFSSDRLAVPSTPLFIMNLDGSHVAPVPYTLGSFYSPSISADLKTVAFVSSHNVWVTNVEGTVQTQLTTNTDDANDNGSFVFYARISPNGKKILYSFWDGVNGINGVWIINADGTGKVNLTATLPTGMIGCYTGSFSADSSKITFNCFGQNGYSVFAANADGSHVSTVVPETASGFLDSPMFSPDGKKILFLGFNFTPGGASKANVAPHKPSLAAMRSGVHSEVAPGIAGTQGVFSVNLDGTGDVLVVPNAFEAEILNSTLYYAINDSDLGLNQIWKANPDGSAAASVSDGTANDRLDLTVD